VAILRGDRVAAGFDEGINPPQQSRQLRSAEVGGEAGAEVATELLAYMAQLLDYFPRDLKPGETPQNGTQLLLHMERQAVVYRPEPGVLVTQNVTRLAISIVEHKIKYRDRPEDLTGSTWRCTAPGPNGPSAIVVSGTLEKPRAWSIRKAHTSRNARVLASKSHSGRAPSTGL